MSWFPGFPAGHSPIFPGYPGPLNPRGPGVGGVAMPAPLSQPQGPSAPMGPGHPGGFGPAFSPGFPQGVAGGPALDGLAAHGVPVRSGPMGNPMLMAGAAGRDGGMMAPNIAGMPTMPPPPGDMFGGGSPQGGLFRPLDPVQPFNPANQVQGYPQQGLQF